MGRGGGSCSRGQLFTGGSISKGFCEVLIKVTLMQVSLNMLFLFQMSIKICIGYIGLHVQCVVID